MLRIPQAQGKITVLANFVTRFLFCFVCMSIRSI